MEVSSLASEKSRQTPPAPWLECVVLFVVLILCIYGRAWFGIPLGVTVVVSLATLSFIGWRLHLWRSRLEKCFFEWKTALQELEFSQTELSRLAKRIQNAQEEERSHISREIHDEIGQSLTIIKMDLFALRKDIGATLDTGSQTIVQKITESIQGVHRVLEQVRGIASGLRPRVLEDLGLSAALEWLKQEVARRANLKCHLHFEVQSPLTKEQELGLFRIAQEALTNSLRHAKSPSIDIDVFETDGSVVLKVRDYGLNPPRNINDLRGQYGFGVANMRERAKSLGAEFAIEGSREGPGTLVYVRLPLLNENLINSEILSENDSGSGMT